MAKLLPPNSTQFEINFESAFSRVSDIENPTRKFNDPMTAPSQVLPWLAWEKSVDVWDKNWNEDQKRNAIAASYSVHAHKGTIGSLEQAVDALGLNVTIREWFQTVPMLKPYTFEVFIEVSQIGITEPQYKKLIDVVNANKNLRSHWRFANTFVISEAHAEIVNLPICRGHDFEYSETAGSDIFNVWSDWILKTPIMVKKGIVHYKAYKFDNVMTLESYADLDLTQTVVLSLHDTDMQQWQAVKDTILELTGVFHWEFNNEISGIKYAVVSNPEAVQGKKWCWTSSGGCSHDSLAEGSASLNYEDICKFRFELYKAAYGSLAEFKSCLISGDGGANLTWRYYWNSEDSVDYIGRTLNPSYDPNFKYDVVQNLLSYTDIAQKIISNAQSTDQAISLFAEAYLENMAQSIFNTDESKQFVKLSDLIDQFEENKI